MLQIPDICNKKITTPQQISILTWECIHDDIKSVFWAPRNPKIF